MGFTEYFVLWVGALLTLMIFSFLYKDNPYYKFAEHLFVGVSAAYWMTVGFWTTLVPNMFGYLHPPVLGLFATSPAEGAVVVNAMYDLPWYERWLRLAPLIFGIMLLTRLLPKGAWLSRWAMAFIIGFAAGTNLPRYLQSDFIAQIKATLIPIVVYEEPSPAFSDRDFKDQGQFVLDLKNGGDPLTVYFRENFSDQSRTLLTDYDGSEAPSGDLAEALVGDLNDILEKEPIYSEQRFAHVELSDQNREMIKEKPVGVDQVRLNRRLMADAYEYQFLSPSGKRFNLGRTFSHLVIIIGVLSALVYFFFSKEHKGWFGGTARVGIWTLMIAFGAAFGYTVMARISLLIGRMGFLGEWLNSIF